MYFCAPSIPPRPKSISIQPSILGSSIVVMAVDNLERVEQGGRWQTNPCVHEVLVAELADEVMVCEAEATVVGWREVH